MKTKLKETIKKVFRRADIFLVLFVLLVVALTAGLTYKKKSNEVNIYIKGELKYTYNIESNIEINLYNDGIDMIISIENGKVFVKHSDCPEQLCVHAHAISSDGGTIVCLPNRVIIKVESDEVDAVT